MTTESGDVLSALRLGWGVAELRGRNRPGAPTGADVQMPDHFDHPLPLRIERGQPELRIEAQYVVATLAKNLHVGSGQALDDDAKLLSHTRAPTASATLAHTLEVLKTGNVSEALATLRAGQSAQCAIVKRRMDAVADARKVADEHRHHEKAREARALQVEKACLSSEARGLAALDEVIATLEQAKSAIVGIDAIDQRQRTIAMDAAKAWASLAELIWAFDAHVQDAFTAASESQAIAYQLGRGLAETYWALDPDAADGTMSWSFLLGRERCSELSRLMGRLSSYFDDYTGPAIAGSIEVWQDVASTPAWLGNRRDTQLALYRQIRRWFELLCLGQNPTTLVPPGAVMKDYRALLRAVRLFWPQLAGIAVGAGFLAALSILASVGTGPAWVKTVTGIIGVGGLSVAGLTGLLKNSGQALLKRWRQDSYTDLVARAVQTAPEAPKKSAVQKAIRRRRLTPVTSN